MAIIISSDVTVTVFCSHKEIRLCIPIGAHSLFVIRNYIPEKAYHINALPARRSRSGVWGIPQQAKIRLGSTQTLLATTTNH